jgi:Tfp pilus assembly protein PilP
MATTTTTTIVPRVFQGQDEPMLDQENEHLKANQQSDQAYPDAASRRGSASLTKFSKHGFDLVGLIKADSSSVENAMNMVSGTGKVLAEKSDAKTLLGTPNRFVH